MRARCLQLDLTPCCTGSPGLGGEEFSELLIPNLERGHDTLLNVAQPVCNGHMKGLVMRAFMVGPFVCVQLAGEMAVPEVWAWHPFYTSSRTLIVCHLALPAEPS